VRLDTPALWVLAGAESDPGGGADGRVDVEVGEATAFGGEAIDIRRGNEIIAEAAGVAVTHVVDEKDQDVGFGRGMDRCQENQKAARNKREGFAHDGIGATPPTCTLNTRGGRLGRAHSTDFYAHGKGVLSLRE
jgi:hypothetical protein